MVCLKAQVAWHLTYITQKALIKSYYIHTASASSTSFASNLLKTHLDQTSGLLFILWGIPVKVIMKTNINFMSDQLIKSETICADEKQKKMTRK